MFNIGFFIFRRDLRLDIFFGLARKFGVGFGGQVYFDDIPAKDFAVNKIKKSAQNTDFFIFIRRN
jgi:hypothetical protein